MNIVSNGTRGAHIRGSVEAVLSHPGQVFDVLGRALGSLSKLPSATNGDILCHFILSDPSEQQRPAGHIMLIALDSPLQHTTGGVCAGGPRLPFVKEALQQLLVAPQKPSSPKRTFVRLLKERLTSESLVCIVTTLSDRRAELAVAMDILQFLSATRMSTKKFISSVPKAVPQPSLASKHVNTKSFKP